MRQKRPYLGRTRSICFAMQKRRTVLKIIIQLKFNLFTVEAEKWTLLVTQSLLVTSVRFFSKFLNIFFSLYFRNIFCYKKKALERSEKFCLKRAFSNSSKKGSDSRPKFEKLLIRGGFSVFCFLQNCVCTHIAQMFAHFNQFSVVSEIGKIVINHFNGSLLEYLTRKRSF